MMYINIQLKDCVDIHMRNASYNENSEHHQPICDSHFRTSCILNCPKSPDMDELLSKVSDKTDQYETHTYQFHSFLWAATIAWVGMAVVVTIADAICIDLLGNIFCDILNVILICKIKLDDYLLQAMNKEKIMENKRCGEV